MKTFRLRGNVQKYGPGSGARGEGEGGGGGVGLGNAGALDRKKQLTLVDRRTNIAAAEKVSSPAPTRHPRRSNS